MGMFDSFVLKTPIQCTNCYTGAHKEFQTKELRCNLDYFNEGEPAFVYGLRDLTAEERDAALTESYNQNGINATERFFRPLIMMQMTRDKTRIVSRLSDGIYPAYIYCKNCDEFCVVNMEVKDGIFIGVAKE